MKARVGARFRQKQADGVGEDLYTAGCLPAEVYTQYTWFISGPRHTPLTMVRDNDRAGAHKPA